MKRITIAAIALVLLAATAGMATAQPGDTTETAADAEPGPPGGLPDQVPDFVSDILNSIGEFLSGALDGILGDAVSEDAGSTTGN